MGFPTFKNNRTTPWNLKNVTNSQVYDVGTSCLAQWITGTECIELYHGIALGCLSRDQLGMRHEGTRTHHPFAILGWHRTSKGRG